MKGKIFADSAKGSWKCLGEREKCKKYFRDVNFHKNYFVNLHSLMQASYLLMQY